MAGGHHAFFLGTPGIGKTHVKSLISALLPPLTAAEAMQRQLQLPLDRWDPETGRIVQPGANITRQQLLGNQQQAGLLGQLQHGVLFLDELPGFRQEVLEALRQPLDPSETQTPPRVSFPTFSCVATGNPLAGFGDG